MNNHTVEDGIWLAIYDFIGNETNLFYWYLNLSFVTQNYVYV
jgi:hypothetical protein